MTKTVARSASILHRQCTVPWRSIRTTIPCVCNSSDSQKSSQLAVTKVLLCAAAAVQPWVQRAQHAVTTPLRRWQQRQKANKRLQQQGGCVVEWYVPVMELEPGDCVLICGDGEALGRWNPLEAPVLSLEREEDCWLYRTRMDVGVFRYKLVLVRADGSAAWEEGPFRELKVLNVDALRNPPPIVLELNFNNTYLDNVTDYIQNQLAALESK